MAGLLSTGGNMPPAPPSSAPPSAPSATPPAAPAQDAPTDEGGGEPTPNVTPEEQAQYDQFVNNGLEVIYGDDGQGGEETARPDILARLKESSDPVENLANTATWLVTMLETSAEKGGAQIADDVVMHAGQALLEELATVAEAANIHDYSETQMEGAWYKALDLYRETATQDGRIDPEQLKQQFGEIQQADEQGKMGEMFPQLAGKEGAAPPEEGA